MSGFYIGVDGKARKVKGGYIGIDGKARKIKKGYIGDGNGVARLCWTAFEVSPVFADNTWEQIAIACEIGKVPDSWVVGNQKTMTIDGVSYAVDIIGKNHDDYSDGSGKAPLTFQLHDCYNTMAVMHTEMTNSIGWVGCTMRNTTLPGILAKMPAEVRNKVRAVNKTTDKGGTVSATADKLFLLSEIEYRGELDLSKAGEGTRYAYYASNSISKKYAGAECDYWTRSPYVDDYFLFVRSNHQETFGRRANTELAFSFAFCL